MNFCPKTTYNFSESGKGYVYFGGEKLSYVNKITFYEKHLIIFHKRNPRCLISENFNSSKNYVAKFINNTYSKNFLRNFMNLALYGNSCLVQSKINEINIPVLSKSQQKYFNEICRNTNDPEFLYSIIIKISSLF